MSNFLLYQDGIQKVRRITQELGEEVSFVRGRMDNSLNLFLKINPSWLPKLPSVCELMNYIEQLKKVNLGRNRDLNRRFIYLFVLWEVYKDTEELQRFSHLPHPYESLVKVVINGDYVWRGRDYLEFSELHGIVRDLNLVLPSTKENFLKYIDNSKYNESNGVFFSGVPNQEEINDLWKAYQIEKRIV